MSLSAGRSSILFATDGSQGSSTAEAYAFALARSWSASLTVLHVLEFPSGLDPENPVNRLYLAELMKQATQELVELKARAADRGISAETKIATGIPSEEVLAAATGEEPDLIVRVDWVRIEPVELGVNVPRQAPDAGRECIEGRRCCG